MIIHLFLSLFFFFSDSGHFFPLTCTLSHPLVPRSTKTTLEKNPPP